MIKFISYNGRFPNLCSGTLTIEVAGKIYNIENAMCSGGSVGFDNNWNEHVSSGEWSIDDDYLPKELLKHKEEIECIVNENVEYGCCGGCV